MMIDYKILTKNSNGDDEFIDLVKVDQINELPIPNIGELILLDKTLYKVAHKVIVLDGNKVPYKINIVLEVI